MIFSKPIEEIDIDYVRTFCQEGIKEGFHLEYKKECTKDLPKTICAFANTWGGTILVGVGEDNECKPELPVEGVKYQKTLDVQITSMVVDNIYPPVFCEKKVIKFPSASGDRAVVVIRVPESDKTPHAVDHGRSVYIRTDDRNKPEQRATVEQLEWLWDRRKKAEELKQTLYTTADERLTRIYGLPRLWGNLDTLVLGRKPVPGRATFSAVPLFPNHVLTSVEELKALCLDPSLIISSRNYSDFPGLTGTQSLITTQQSVIRYFQTAKRESGMSYYEFNVYGLVFYQEPLIIRSEDGLDVIRYSNIIARLEQFLTFINKFYDALNVWGLVEIRFSLDDIFELKMIGDSRSRWQDDWFSHDLCLNITRVVRREQLTTEKTDIVKNIVREVCYSFNIAVLDQDIEKASPELTKHTAFSIHRPFICTPAELMEV